MGWHFYRCPWPTEPLNLCVPPINLEPRVHDVLSKQLKQPQGELEKEVNMKGNNDALCLRISRAECGILSPASHFRDFSHMAGDSSDVPGSRHTVFRLSEANTDASLSFLETVGNPFQSLEDDGLLHRRRWILNRARTLGKVWFSNMRGGSAGLLEPPRSLMFCGSNCGKRGRPCWPCHGRVTLKVGRDVTSPSEVLTLGPQLENLTFSASAGIFC